VLPLAASLYVLTSIAPACGQSARPVAERRCPSNLPRSRNEVLRQAIAQTRALEDERTALQGKLASAERDKANLKAQVEGAQAKTKKAQKQSTPPAATNRVRAPAAAPVVPSEPRRAAAPPVHVALHRTPAHSSMWPRKSAM
jgi:hypothetical protein